MPVKFPHILIVEDDADISRLWCLSFKERGFACVIAASMEEAALALAHTKFDIVIVDLKLPNGSGVNTFLGIQAMAPRTPIGVVTGGADEDVPQRCMQAGAIFFLEKPVLGDALARQIGEAMVKHKCEQESGIFQAKADEAKSIIDKVLS